MPQCLVSICEHDACEQQESLLESNYIIGQDDEVACQ
jgi:hypothetical protein